MISGITNYLNKTENVNCFVQLFYLIAKNLPSFLRAKNTQINETGNIFQIIEL